MVATGVVRGKRLRVTRVGNCGLPIPSPRSALVTKGFVTVNLSKEMKDADDLEQQNADGQVCIADRTPPELKWFTFEAEFCKVDPEVLSFFTDDEMVLDYANKPVGFRSSKTVKVNEGAAVELWTGVGSDDCEIPESDDIFEGNANAASYGYFLLPYIKEATLGDIEIGSQVTTFTVSGITGAATNWGRGPYNVVPINAKNEPGRLLTPMGQQHLHFQRTTIAPPEVTEGAVGLTIPQPYFGNADTASVDVVPTVVGGEGTEPGNDTGTGLPGTGDTPGDGGAAGDESGEA